jgi:tetratricopeptide (TPR) repeat protein
MNSDTLQVIVVFGLIGGLGLVFVLLLLIGNGQRRRLLAGDINPLPFVPLIGIPRTTLEEKRAFVVRQVDDLNQIRWGGDAGVDRRQAERMYQAALDAIDEAEGDYQKLPAIVDTLVDLPQDLSLSGAAAVILRLAFLQNGMYIPYGVQAALAFTSAAIKAYPVSVDAWLARLDVTSSVDDARYRAVADDALRKVRGLNPHHPRFPEVEASYYRTYGTGEQSEVALHHMIESAPSPVVKRRGYDRLAWQYATTKRLDEALATYQQLFREQPEGSAWTWHNYSLVLLRAKRYQEALDASNHALSFFEFGVARHANNAARTALGMPVVGAVETGA